jgi:hypothetical protein
VVLACIPAVVSIRNRHTSLDELAHSHHHLHIPAVVSTHGIIYSCRQWFKGAERGSRSGGFKGTELVQPTEEAIVHCVLEQELNVGNSFCKAKASRTVHQ